MAVLWSGKRLRLRDAGLEDLDYIMELQADPENSKYISAFPRDMQEAILAGQTGTRDLIAESIETGKRYGYAMVNGADDTLFRTAEWTHIVVTKKGQGYGHELMRLLKAWTFEGLRFHRAGWTARNIMPVRCICMSLRGWCARVSRERLSRQMAYMRISSYYQSSIMSTRRASRMAWSYEDNKKKLD